MNDFHPELAGFSPSWRFNPRHSGTPPTTASAFMMAEAGEMRLAETAPGENGPLLVPKLSLGTSRWRSCQLAHLEIDELP